MEIRSPLGQIVFMSIDKKLKDQNRLYKSGDKVGEQKEYFSIKLLFDTEIQEHADFKELLKEVNPKLIGTESKLLVKDTQFLVGARSMFDIKVTDINGQELTGDSIPQFDSRCDKGTARFGCVVYEKGKQPSIPLKAVQLGELEIAPEADRPKKESSFNFDGFNEALTKSKK